MRLTLDRIAGLVFLAFCIAYGLLAGNIELYFGGENEPFTARTFPTVLAWFGSIIAFLIVVLPSRDAESADAATIRRLDWRHVLPLLVLMILYGLTIKSVGFFVSTSVFLLAGFLILGERRWLVLAAAPIPIVATFQFLLHDVLGIYIADPVLQALGIIS